MSLSLLGKRVVILNSEEAVTELFEKRGANYADRPSYPLYERVGWKDALILLPYGTYYRKLRKMLQLPFEKDKAPNYRHIQEQEACVLLHNFLRDPSSVEGPIHRYTAAIIIEIAFGHRVLSDDDEHLKAADMFVEVQHGAGRPSLLDVSPIFEKLPSWFPGAWHVRYIKEKRPMILHAIQHPVSVIRQQLVDGTANPSFVSQQLNDLIREGGLTPENQYDLSIVAHMIFGGGSETTWNTLTTFIACMLMNPEVQRKGQEELDRVVGRGRLPDFTDRDSLPYIECVMKETMRWHPVAPLAMPRRAIEDDEYHGMYIPKGAMVIANIRSLTWDERRFHDARSFKPERFLPKPEGAGEVLPPSFAFGWGRRICPGRYLADDVVWIAVARILATLDIRKPKAADGSIIEPRIEFEAALTSHPKPFPCEIRPRSDKAAELIKQAYDMHMASVET